jgi:large subunit ribosomal protein L31
MKTGIHPKYVESIVICACGNTFTTRSTRPQIRTDLCSVCHPFYTGEQRIVDSAGQVERFMRRVEAASGGARPSKRQQRLTARAEREAQSRRAAQPDGTAEESTPQSEPELAAAEAPDESAAS